MVILFIKQIYFLNQDHFTLCNSTNNDVFHFINFMVGSTLICFNTMDYFETNIPSCMQIALFLLFDTDTICSYCSSLFLIAQVSSN